jgi:hypothetical protein
MYFILFIIYILFLILLLGPGLTLAQHVDSVITGTFDQCALEITSGNVLTFLCFTEVFWHFDQMSFI